MKRYTTLLVTAFIFFLVVAVGMVQLSSFADRERKNGKNLQKITVYTTLPLEHAGILAESYEKTFKVRVNFVPITREQIIDIFKNEQKSNALSADLVLADEEVLSKGAMYGAFVPYSTETTDALAERFVGADDAWVGVWYDPVVFCINRDYLATLKTLPNSWHNLAYGNNLRLGMTDFLAADAASNLLFSLYTHFGNVEAEKILRALHRKVVQYVKYLSTPVRMAGMGEVDLSVAMQSETLRYIHDGYPLRILYPKEGTPCFLTGVGLLKDGEEGKRARAFADWLLGDEVQVALQNKNFFFMPTNTATMSYKIFGSKNVVLFPKKEELSSKQKHDLLDYWVKSIRLQEK